MLAVTGATGQLGHLVIDALLKETPASNVLAIGRTPDKAEDLTGRGVGFRRANYDDPASLATALDGASKVLLISSSEVGKRAAQHKALIDAASAAQVALLAYTSILHADDSPIGLASEHRATEAELKQSGLPFVLLRNGWYSENYTGALAPALQHGLIGCSGDGRISAAPRADYAAAAARVLLDDGHAGRTYELAGDESFTMAELAAEISKQSGKSVAYTNLSQADYKAALVAAGLPEAVAAMIADSSAATARGALFDESRQLSGLIGRPTTSIGEVVRAALAKLG